jgi:hypothetical protein
LSAFFNLFHGVVEPPPFFSGMGPLHRDRHPIRADPDDAALVAARQWHPIADYHAACYDRMHY